MANIRWKCISYMNELKIIDCINHARKSIEKYHVITLDGARTIKKIVNDKCYETPEVVRWQYKKSF